MYDFMDNEDDGLDGIAEFTQPIQSEGEEIASREWSRMSDQFTSAGYREGITAGKESALQGGFDRGFADVGAPVGRHVGNLRGLAAGLLSFLDSSRHQCSQACETGALPLHDDLRSIVERLSRIHFADLEPPDTEALEHALEHSKNDNGDPRVQVNVDTKADRSGLSELTHLRENLAEIVKRLGLDVVFDVPTCLV
ncbi:hypothetical protein DFH11DRAFT_532854 [Phellopilus nigrolimitatus]|nr:hypothetical protein DFH11DRAFT_532854 [Phellopilus nigrolimitatus]